MHPLVFVFGTLKEGFPNCAINHGTRMPGVFVTRQRYPLYLMGERHSPWLIDQPGVGERVQGQVFAVDPATLDAMDALERVAEPDGYRRTGLDVECIEAGERRTLRAFAYLKPLAQWDPAQVRCGPLADYTREHAARYRPRS